MNEFTRKAMELVDDYSLARIRDEWVTWQCLGMTAGEAAEGVMNRARSALLAHLEGGEQKWISVKDRLPDNNVNCLVFFSGELYGIAGLRIPHKGQMLWHGHSGSHNDVTHWCPIPATPTEEASK